MDNGKRYERLLERYGNGGIERRSFLGLLGLAGVAAGVGGAAMTGFTRHARAASAIRYDGWGGNIQAAFDRLVLKSFAERAGVKVNQGSFSSWEEYLIQVQTSPSGTYNFFDCLNQFPYLRFTELGLGVVLDESKIPGLGNVIPKVVNEYRKISNGTLSAVPYSLSDIAIAYNTRHVDRAYIEEKGVDILLDPKFKGKILGENYWLRRMWYAALQSGQDPNNITDVEAVWAKIRESKKVVAKYWRSGAEQMSLLANEEGWISDAWGGRIYALRKAGHPIDVYFGKGFSVSPDGLMVLKGTPLDEAYQLIEILMKPEVGVALALEYGYPSALDPTKVPMPKEMHSVPLFDPTGKLEGVKFTDAHYWNRHLDWQKQYTEVLSRA